MTTQIPNMRETDLYAPIRDYLKAQGYKVRGEVKGCDVVATKGDDLIVVELKLRASLDLLAQAIERQRVSDSVYVALPRPSYKVRRSSQHRGFTRLLRRLALGLIFVSLDSDTPEAEIVHHPGPYEPKKSKRKRRAIIQEAVKRSGDYNKGGSSRKKLITVYRENAIYIACCLAKHGELSPKQLREMGAGQKTLSILHSNFYGWFVRVERGIYTLTGKGKSELKGYTTLKRRFLKRLREENYPSF